MCYNELMVKRNTLKTNILSSFVVFTMVITAITINFSNGAYAIPSACNTVNGTTTCTNSTTFNVNVSEVLTVSITEPQTWASGASDSFLKNKVSINVVSNNPAGITASMTTSNADPSLVNTADNLKKISTISTAGGVALANATGNSWGYSVVNANAAEPTTYYGMVGLGTANPIEIVKTTAASSSAIVKDIYFGAKSDGTSASGTYESGVLISVVTGVVDTGEPTPVNPVTPVNPITPSDDTTPNDNTGTDVQAPKGNTQYGAVVATTTTTDNIEDTITTTTESYAKPAGVTNTTAAVLDAGTPLATGLAATAVASATAGIIFFIVAKRRRDEDEEEDENI